MAFDKVYKTKVGLSIADKDKMATEVKDRTIEQVVPPLSRTFVNQNEKGVKNGVATLDNNGQIPQSQLPSFVDEIIEGALTSLTTFTATDGTIYDKDNASGKIFIDVGTNKSYRWSGTQFTEITAGQTIEANNGKDATELLNTLRVDATNYSIPSAKMSFSSEKYPSGQKLKSISIIDRATGLKDLYNVEGGAGDKASVVDTTLQFEQALDGIVLEPNNNEPTMANLDKLKIGKVNYSLQGGRLYKHIITCDESEDDSSFLSFVLITKDKTPIGELYDLPTDIVSILPMETLDNRTNIFSFNGRHLVGYNDIDFEVGKIVFKAIRIEPYQYCDDEVFDYFTGEKIA